MKLVFYSLILNHHQACLADEFYKIQKKAREEGKGFWGTGFFEEE